jgi:N utilization substance protein A
MPALLTNAELESIGILASRTGASATDVVLTDDSVIFVVTKGELGKAIGKNGSNIIRLKSAFGRNVEIVEAADGIKEFLSNVFKPAKVLEVREENQSGKKIAFVSVEVKDKGLAIGRGGERIKKARLLAKRRFGLDDVKIS